VVRGQAFDLGVGLSRSEPLFLVTLTSCTLRAREGVVQDSETSVYKMHEKDSEDSVYKMHEKNSETSEDSPTSREGGRWKIEGREMGDGRWKMGEVPTPPESRRQRHLELAGRRPAPQPENL